MLEASRWQDDHIEMVDQTQLPQQEIVLHIRTLEELEDAIRALRIRGAPAIGVVASYGVVLGVKNLSDADQLNSDSVEQVFRRLASTRPTAVNLFWALERMRKVTKSVGLESGSVLVNKLLSEARAIHNQDKELCRNIGRYGAQILPEGGILTHCHAGALATGGIGTALGIVRTAHEMGKSVHVYVDETRPLLQGARLTAWELEQLGIPVTLICDNMAGSLMASGKIQMVVMGADRIARNGDAANKIGTYSVAVLAHHHNIPFVIAAPSTTIDQSLQDGSQIPIEERNPDEVRGFRGIRWAPDTVPVWNPAFDVTPAGLISAIVTESGVHRPPYDLGDSR
jgi:methylthioribose-1-phosphate isomerase